MKPSAINSASSSDIRSNKMFVKKVGPGPYLQLIAVAIASAIYYMNA